MIIYCDGGSRGNPGPAASAFVVTVGINVIDKGSRYLGIETNNVAEYRAVLLAVDWLIKNDKKNPSTILFNLDSQLVERQLNGLYKVKNENLKKIYNEIKTKISILNCEIKFQWGYRDANKLADTLVNEELDSKSSCK